MYTCTMVSQHWFVYQSNLPKKNSYIFVNILIGTKNLGSLRRVFRSITATTKIPNIVHFSNSILDTGKLSSARSLFCSFRKRFTENWEHSATIGTQRADLYVQRIAGDVFSSSSLPAFVSCFLLPSLFGVLRTCLDQ